MARLLAVGGFSGGFLVISPGLRQTVLDGIGFATHLIQQYSPWSYAAVVVAIFGGITVTLLTGQNGR